MADMDSPVKSFASPSSTNPNSLSQFEDSPIFSYINNLSPIKPLNGEQGSNFHGFASPQILVTSPTANFPRKHNVSVRQLNYPFKSNSSDGKSEIRKNQATIDGLQLHTGEAESTDTSLGVTTNDMDISPMERNGLQDYLKSGVGIKVESASDEITEMSTEIHGYTGSGHGGYYDYKSDGADYNSACQIEVDQLLSEFPFEKGDPEETVNNYANSEMFSFMENILRPPSENIDEFQKIDSSPPGYCEGLDIEIPLTHPSAAERLCEAGQSSAYAQTVDEAYSNTSASVNNEHQILLPRRSLAFEMSGNNSIAATNEGQPVSGKNNAYCFSSQQPGVALHLNTLVMSRRGTIVVKEEPMTYDRQPIDMPCTPSLHSSSFDPGLINSPFDLKPMGEDLESITSEQKLNEIDHRNPAITSPEELTQSSNKRKRCDSEVAEEGGSCKRCNCKRSKCLKLYCECFAAGLYCIDNCSCQGCLNKPDLEETVMETRRQIEARNPLAFAPKVITISDISGYPVTLLNKKVTLLNNASKEEINTTPASARHKRGCNCRKSGCLKKYCECFQGGVGCSSSCRCEGCKNSFGQKDGYHILVPEEPEASENNSADLNSREVVSVDIEHHDPQATPSSQHSRNRVFPASLASRFSSFSSGLLQPCTNHSLGEKAYSFSPKGNFAALDKASEDEDGVLTSATIKSMSPNSKRVLPHRGPSNPPVRKFCRKLILRSIPYFPTLTEQTQNGMSADNSS